MRRRIIGMAAIFLVAALSAALAFGYKMTRPHPSYVEPARPPAQDLTLTSPDGLRLTATYWPGSAKAAPGVLILHGVGSSRGKFRGNAEWLAGQGYGVLTLDFRGHGQSDIAIASFGLFEARDARAGYDWLKQKQENAPVAVIGVSLGGAAALLGPDGPLPAQAMILHAVYPDIRRAIRNRLTAMLSETVAWVGEPLLSLQSFLWYGTGPGALAPVEAMKQFAGPAMIVASSDDRLTTLADTQALYASIPGPKRIWLAKGYSHGDIADIDTPEYRARLGDFLAAAIGAPPKNPPSR